MNINLKEDFNIKKQLHNKINNNHLSIEKFNPLFKKRIRDKKLINKLIIIRNNNRKIIENI